MAIVQISRITQRKGLSEDLPQLDGAELGWSTDSRQLFIGNGTLIEGAPVVGNTEVLTEFSDILNLAASYTYKGEAAGYIVVTGPTIGDPVTQSLQDWNDQRASVKNFGAKGDGVTDDTAAINRALYQIYCREVNPQIRRSLFFPAGVYRVTGTINIPPYALLYGEGLDSSIIQLDLAPDDSTVVEYVARFADSLQQTGVNIGTNGATPPTHITIDNLAFENLEVMDTFLVEDATVCKFQNVGFYGPLTEAELITDADDTSCLRFASTASLICSQIVFDGCEFSGATYAASTDQQVEGITINGSKFDTLHKGVVLGDEPPVVNGGATGFRVTSNVFDNVYAQGIIFGDVSLNISGYNIFYDVGNHFGGITQPFTTIIDIQSDNNVSIGDMFARSDINSNSGNIAGSSWQRIGLNNTNSIGLTNSSQLSLGQYTRNSGLRFELVDNTVGATVFELNTATAFAFSMNYTIIRGTATRTGSFMVASQAMDSTGDLSYSDDYVENTSTGITLTFTQLSEIVTLLYTSTSTGDDGVLTYSISYL